jgi:TonB-dependent starch-binding outer membrane protein SusC
MYKKYTQQFLRVMKITTFILFAALMQVSAAGIAQRLTLPKQDISLKELFNQINKQTSYTVAWSATQVNADQQVQVDFKNTPLLEVLDQTLKNTNLTYSIENKTVVIKQKEPTFFDKAKAYFATVTVHGTVTDETNQPMPGVNVRENGTQNGTTTDSKGAFNLSVADNDAIITFTYVGYEPKEISAKELPNGVVITLKPAENNLREVVINKGYYDEKKALSTGDVSVVSAKDIENHPVTDPILALEGQVPGLLISQTSGLPGAYESIRLRGQNSIANGNDPLYIIDGVPFSSISPTNSILGGGAAGNPSGQYASSGGLSPFSALNPEDIENIEVLKDADATAIYGSRGANGVILITTKKGKAGAVKINLDLSQGSGQVTRMMKMMNTPQYLQMEHQAFANDGLPFPSIMTNLQDPNYSINGVWDTTRNTNWQKALMGNTAHYTNAQLSISGGSQNTQFYVGTGFTRQTTVVPTDNDQDAKGSLNFNINHSSADKRFQFQFSGGYTRDDSTLPSGDPTLTALQLPPDAPVLYLPNGSPNWQLYNGSSTFLNPLLYELQTTENVISTLNSHMLISYQLIPDLRLQSSFGYTVARSDQSAQIPSTSVQPPDNLLASSRENIFGNSESENWIIEPQLSYDRKIAKGKLNIVLGGTIEQSTSNTDGFVAYGYNSDALITNPQNASTVLFAGETNTLYRYEAIYARVGYTWKDKYLLNLTANRDGSSRFGPANQWGNFGALGAGWVFSKEKFVENILSWLSFGKLRGSYGVTGNDQIADYGYLSSYSTIPNLSYQGSVGFNPTSIPNPNYGWETDKKLEGGIELGFLKDRINFTASYYRNRTSNQLVGYTLPTISGFTTVEENLPAVVQNTGAEFTLHTLNIQSGAFRWTTDINLTIPSSKLLSYQNLAASSYRNTYIIGQSLFIKKLYTGTKVNPADGKYEWISANGTYTENPSFPADLRATPPLTPKYYGALGNSFSYKDFQLDVFFEFRKQLAFNFWYLSTEPGGPGVNQPVAIIGNTWTTQGQQAKYGILSTENASDPNGYTSGSSDHTISDASFIRLKNVALSWTLPKNWQQAIYLQNAKLFLRGENLLTITNYLGLDPETGSTVIPPLRLITLGIHSSF